MKIENIFLKVILKLINFNQNVNQVSDTNIYNFEIKSINEKIIKFSQFKGKVILLVNTASFCGFTKQYKGLE